LRAAQAAPEGEAAYKALRRGGAEGGRDNAAPLPSRAPRTGQRTHSMYGLTIVSGERGDIRQSPYGLLVYDDDGKREVNFPADHDGRDVMIDQFRQAIVTDSPPPHDGRWGLASLEVQLAILESGRTRREVELVHQVAARSPRQL
jgi:phthalate 4,5-cis-dihydrodiol dehydrogenase